VTLTDSRGCQAVFAAAVPQGPPVTRSETAELCPGEAFSLGGAIFAAPGSYTVVLPGQAGACDTVVQLQISVLPDPALAVALLPASLTLSCAAPQADVCAGSAPGFLYAWQLDGLPYGTGPCVTAITAGLLTLKVTSTGAGALCTAQDTITVDAFFDPPALGATVVAASGPTQADGQIAVTATGGLAPYVFTWDEFITGDSVGGLLPGTYCLTVTDARGCTRDSCLTVSFTAGVNTLAAVDALRLYPNPAVAGGPVCLEWTGAGETPRGIELTGADGRAWGRWEWPAGTRVAGLSLPATLPSGPIFLRVLSGNRLIVKKLGIGSPEP
jgi:hypothetical protein